VPITELAEVLKASQLRRTWEDVVLTRLRHPLQNISGPPLMLPEAQFHMWLVCPPWCQDTGVACTEKFMPYTFRTSGSGIERQYQSRCRQQIADRFDTAPAIGAPVPAKRSNASNQHDYMSNRAVANASYCKHCAPWPPQLRHNISTKTTVARPSRR
jgi:hypothetical protein